MATGTRTSARSREAGPQAGDFWILAKSFERTLQARNLSPATIRIYKLSVEALGDFLTAQGMPTVVTSITGEHLREFLHHVRERGGSAGTAETRYRGIKQFFKWALEEGEITDDPMAKVKRPMVPETPPPMLTDDQVRRLLKTCEGREFKDRRDTAIFRLFFDTGMRRSELAYLKMADVDLEHNLEPSCWARAGGPGSVRLAARPPRPSTATSASERRIDIAMTRRYGSDRRDRSAMRLWTS